MFEMMSVLFPIIFVVVLAIIILKMLMGVKEWHDNNQQPILTVDAIVATKRSHVSQSSHNHGNGHVHHHTSTTYYVTFQVESGDRMELKMPAQQYGLLAEGDRGRLTFQGTRFHDFTR